MDKFLKIKQLLLASIFTIAFFVGGIWVPDGTLATDDTTKTSTSDAFYSTSSACWRCGSSQ
jgi:hypothetical protein